MQTVDSGSMVIAIFVVPMARVVCTPEAKIWKLAVLLLLKRG
jgi:hypothetical protein